MQTLSKDAFDRFEQQFCAQFGFLFRDYGFTVVWRGIPRGGMAVWCIGIESAKHKLRIEALGGERGEAIAIGPLSAEFEHSDGFCDRLPWQGLYVLLNQVRGRYGLPAVWPTGFGEPRNNPLPFGDLPQYLQPVFAEVIELVKSDS